MPNIIASFALPTSRLEAFGTGCTTPSRFRCRGCSHVCAARCSFGVVPDLTLSDRPCLLHAMVPRKNISTKLQPRAVHMLCLATHAGTERILLNSSTKGNSSHRDEATCRGNRKSCQELVFILSDDFARKCCTLYLFLRCLFRYYDDPAVTMNSAAGNTDSELADLKPGQLSSETRAALGLGPLDPPPWLDRMRQLGYPPMYK